MTFSLAHCSPVALVMNINQERRDGGDNSSQVCGEVIEGTVSSDQKTGRCHEEHLKCLWAEQCQGPRQQDEWTNLAWDGHQTLERV